MNLKLFLRLGVVISSFTATNLIAAPASPDTAVSSPNRAVRDASPINDWLQRMHDAARDRSYIGTYVVASGGVMSIAKIWHVCEGGQQVERIDSLSGPARSIFRHNDKVVTFVPADRVVRTETHEGGGLFPELLQSTDRRIADHYALKPQGNERVAGMQSEVVLLSPYDKLRFAYRVWTEPKRGVVVKLQTLDPDGKVLEQAAFSELQLDAPLKMESLMQMMDKLDGWRVEQPALVKTSASAEGWAMKAAVPGFRSVSFYKRPISPGSGSTIAPVQWNFSDGLASVSLFVEPLDGQRRTGEASLSLGATQTLTRPAGAYLITAIGEVPVATLRLFSNGLERSR